MVPSVVRWDLEEEFPSAPQLIERHAAEVDRLLLSGDPFRLQRAVGFLASRAEFLYQVCRREGPDMNAVTDAIRQAMIRLVEFDLYPEKMFGRLTAQDRFCLYMRALLTERSVRLERPADPAPGGADAFDREAQALYETWKRNDAPLI